jgi:hypothetical protein
MIGAGAGADKRRLIAFGASSLFAMLVSSVLATLGVFAVRMTVGQGCPAPGLQRACRNFMGWLVAGGVGQWLVVAASVAVLAVGACRPQLRSRLHWLQIGIAVLAVVVFGLWAMAAAGVAPPDNWD